MKAIIKREIKSFLKNPIFWIGLVIMTVGIYQLLEPYLNVHYFKSNQEIQSIMVANPDDADVMYGYVPSSAEEEREAGFKELRSEMVDRMGQPEQEADTVIDEIRDMSVSQACRYLESEYGIYNAEYFLDGVGYKQGSAKEVNGFLDAKLQEHSFSYYFARKFADFAGLFLAFFATILLAFLFLVDTRKNIYELLHTKPMTAWQYVLGKTAGGFFSLAITLGILTTVFSVLCMVYGKAGGFSVNAADLIFAACVYILPNMLMIVSVYAITALIFKNPLPATPLLFLYILYSNMGSTGGDGKYGYRVRALSILVRFPGKFFDTELPSMLVLNQILLIMASVVFVTLSVYIWKRRRVY